jgi:urease accessory protein
VLPLLRLLQLASPSLPVGAYSYSQGLERAVEAELVHDEASAARWVEDVLNLSVARCDAPCLLAMMQAAGSNDTKRLAFLNDSFLATRESAELRAETVQLGRSLLRVLEQLEAAAPTDFLRTLSEPAYPCAWACAASAFVLPAERALAAYVWAWLENQVLAAVKLVPLGQSAGQRILFRLGPRVAQIAEQDACGPADWCNYAPGLAWAAVSHETQYTRLFRS